MFEFGYSQEDITPVWGLPLVGYFNPRPNRGAYDRLSVKAAVFRTGDECVGVVSFDLCFVTRALVKRFQEGVEKAGLPCAGKVIYSATHTHTGPYTTPCFGPGEEGCCSEEYLADLVAKTVKALTDACKSLAPAELYNAKTNCHSLAFCRRFKMKNGKTLTNPGKLNPDIDCPEDEIDSNVYVMAVKQEGQYRLIMTNISNHTDTIGGDYVSGDWPVAMEAEIQHELDCGVPVMTIIAPQGNINHFNVATDANQTSYAEARRIGKAYGQLVYSALYGLNKVECDSLKFVSTEMEMPYMKVTDEEYAEAKKVYEANKDASMEAGRDFTSEDIAKGHPYVMKFFAERLMSCRDNAIPGQRFEELAAITFGDKIAISTLPCEAFVEFSREIRKDSKYPMTMVAALAQGEIGYIGMPHNYGNGGYETSPSNTVADRNIGPEMLKTAKGLLK